MRSCNTFSRILTLRKRIVVIWIKNINFSMSTNCIDIEKLYLIKFRYASTRKELKYLKKIILFVI